VGGVESRVAGTVCRGVDKGREGEVEGKSGEGCEEEKIRAVRRGEVWGVGGGDGVGGGGG